GAADGALAGLGAGRGSAVRRRARFAAAEAAAVLRDVLEVVDAAATAAVLTLGTGVVASRVALRARVGDGRASIGLGAAVGRRLEAVGACNEKREEECD